MKKNNQSGFSLVELMVVVAIIGILATVAVPNFQRFQARAKQSSAKTELTGMYTAQKSFYVEYNQYHGHLPVVGYVPDGIGGVNYNPIAGANRLYGTSAGGPAEPGALGSGLPTASDVDGAADAYDGAFEATNTCTNTNATVAANIIANNEGADPTSATTTFLGVAKGCPGERAVIDTWTINQNRILVNAQNGI
ncbi:prepilin-type N-terminal cleavage/methylation domain-containing protein [bacterium]|nr:prepilin-type N-terminal cleavage/methylation domain-containing protein [bacterium]